MAIHASEIQWQAHDRTHTAHLAAPAAGGPGLLVLPSWWGLKPFFKDVCAELAERGFTALAPDYYAGQVAHTLDEAKTLQQGVEGDPEGMGAFIQSAAAQLVARRPGQPIGLVGFSMGTDWAIMTAAQDPDIAAVVLFYGGWSTDFSRMKAKVLGHYAEHDEWVPFEQIQEMERNLQAAGVDVSIYRYPGTAHWFMESDRPEYDPAAAQLAWERTYPFLQANVK